jgi:glycosyltransferase involved in cell wall biosynthesis
MAIVAESFTSGNDLRSEPRTKISIIILAYNEATRLEKSLNSLFSQSIFQELNPGLSRQYLDELNTAGQLGFEINHPAQFDQSNNQSNLGSIPQSDRPLSQLELLIIANGCQDKTVSIAQAVLEKNLGYSSANSISAGIISWKVVDLPQKGKSNAWNMAVHHYSDVDSDSLIFMDADIDFLNPQTLENLIQGFEDYPEAWITTDLPIKGILFQQNRSWHQSLSAAIHSPREIADLTEIERTSICGQLYAGRASSLRKIWLPLDVIVEDGFLRALIITEFFTQIEENPSRIQIIPNASHLFDAHNIHPWAFVRREKRQIAGITINFIVFNRLREICADNHPAGNWIESQNTNNPLWVKDLLQHYRQEKGWWLIPPGFSLRRFKTLQNSQGFNWIKRLPIVLLASVIDHIVFLLANLELHRTGGFGFWGR